MNVAADKTIAVAEDKSELTVVPASSLPTAASRPESPKTALIVEGGGMRGAWACGVLGALHEMGHDHFDIVTAASSGACSAAYFVAGMSEPALRIWQRYVGGQKILRKANWLHFKPFLDLAYLVDYIFRREVPLPVEPFRNGRVRFEIVLTDCITGIPVYFHACDERIFDALRASASLPFATLGYWPVDGRPFADGSLSDPIPIRHILDQGATDITVILTHGPAYRMEPVPRPVARLAYPWYRMAAEAWMHRQTAYNSALEILAHPPSGVRLRVLRPMRELHVERFTDDPTLLRNAITIGHDEAYSQLNPAGVPAKSEA